MKRFLSEKEFIYGLLRSDFLYYLSLNVESKVLNIGCGLGTHVFNAARFAGEVYGCDSSGKNIAFCEERKKSGNVKNVHFLHSDIKSLPFSSNTFDAVLMHDGKNLSHVHALLKPGGVLYFGTARSSEREKYERALGAAGFEKNPEAYLAYPSRELPRFLIPIHDDYALKFVLNMMSAV